MDEVLPPWFVGIDEFPPWAIFMILPSLIIGITASLKVFKLKCVGKTGLKVAAGNANEQKSSGDERLQTDDLLLNDVGIEGAKKLGKDESKLLTKIDPSKPFPIGDEKKPELIDPKLMDTNFSPEEEKKLDPINKSNALPEEPKPSADLSLNNPPNEVKGTEKYPMPPQSFVVEATKSESPATSGSETNKIEDTKSIGFTEPSGSLKILGADATKTTDSKETKVDESSDNTEKNKLLEELQLLTNPVASFSKSSDDGDRKTSVVSEVPPSGMSEPSNLGNIPVHNKVPTVKKTIPDFIPNFKDATPDRKLNLGRTSSPDDEKVKSRSYFLEKSDTEEGSISSKDFPKKASDAESNSKSTDSTRTTPMGATPDLSPQCFTPSNNNYDFNTMESIINAKTNEKHTDKYHLSKLNEAKILSKPFPVDAIDPLSIPGYTPSLSEKPILPKDFIKFSTPATITSYDLVPGPSLLKTVGNVWKYVPLLGTQFVSSLIYSMHSIISSYDRRLKYPNAYPYYYLINKYGPMVRLHGPIGADILVMAVNGQDFPLVHIKARGNKRQSLFDSLNTYRRDATPLSYMLNFPKTSKRIPDNPTLRIDQHYESLERITDDFIKRRKFVRTYTGVKQDENHGNDLLKWAMQCTMDVYFKSKRDFFEESDGESNKILDSFVKASKSVRLCETGIQLWRAFTTLTWLDLVEYCKDMDRFIINEVSQCMTRSSQGKSSGSVVELLLATEELKTTDLLTPLLDLLIINVNMAATTAGYLLYNLSKTPQVQRTLFREVSSVLQKGSGNIIQSDLHKFKYLNACIIETLRMTPPFPVLSRQILEDTKIHSFQIPKGTYIQMVNVLPCARGDVCYDDIGRFQAERWTDKNNSLGGDPFLGLPQWQSAPKFNKDLVLTQVALLVAKVVREYRIEYPTTELFPDGMVLQGTSAPFNFGFIERVI